VFYGGLFFNVFIIPFFTFIYLLFLDLIKSKFKTNFHFALNLLVLLVLSLVMNFLPLGMLNKTHFHDYYIITVLATTSTLLLTVIGTMLVAARIDATKKIYRIAALIAFPLFLGFIVFVYRG
jgi:phosphate starvation-inducible membrane PsiE